ncbi:hypothetical protein F6X40_36615 [Paraburkholderia sp. UCT31]|uniref:hypothetical protein n=1 Tax=Paraburkholderia sp. UCT31 TaxID=2615209 RepID=UPI00165651C0|nr:hypothetical protein [Paraburkholderia sp. UCT31]MBC8742062.1 hypothetical protein [Paraburkholderia sp. UCT31]
MDTLIARFKPEDNVGDTLMTETRRTTSTGWLCDDYFHCRQRFHQAVSFQGIGMVGTAIDSLTAWRMAVIASNPAMPIFVAPHHFHHFHHLRTTGAEEGHFALAAILHP